jgi:hypothetical protein
MVILTLRASHYLKKKTEKLRFLALSLQVSVCKVIFNKKYELYHENWEMGERNGRIASNENEASRSAKFFLGFPDSISN